MNRISAFELHIHPGDALAPAQVSVAVQPGSVVRIWSPRDRKYGPPLSVR